ncbi:hypothetical protein CBER1_10627 [Cercospora berteroae]|uniref:Uncharacterized protein n=1 Tax=Cercospora berteroae TaxID=357750 RepID=A0A2S6CNU3_9PEZI|nr:hypothetical protein CBER1_10627 [Cercospora berteroae]
MALRHNISVSLCTTYHSGAAIDTVWRPPTRRWASFDPYSYQEVLDSISHYYSATPSAHRVTLHLPQQCDSTVTSQDLRPGGQYHLLDRPKALHLHVHVDSKDGRDGAIPVIKPNESATNSQRRGSGDISQDFKTVLSSDDKKAGPSRKAAKNPPPRTLKTASERGPLQTKSTERQKRSKDKSSNVPFARPIHEVLSNSEAVVSLEEELLKSLTPTDPSTTEQAQRPKDPARITSGQSSPQAAEMGSALSSSSLSDLSDLTSSDSMQTEREDHPGIESPVQTTTQASSTEYAETSSQRVYLRDLMPTISSGNTPSEEQIFVVRFGRTKQNVGNAGDGTVACQSVVVAQAGPEHLEYRNWNVACWDINGVLVGGWGNCLSLLNINPRRTYQGANIGLVFDPLFESLVKKDAREALLVQLRRDRIEDKEAPQGLLAAPIMLVHSEHEFRPGCDIQQLEQGYIHIVLDFINEVSHDSLLTKVNIQLEADMTESFDSSIHLLSG